jgi:transcriptional regulator with XRE-family HTH domain
MPKPKRRVLRLRDLYPSFPFLVWDMVKSSDEPTMQGMADRLGVSHGTISKWVHARAAEPELSFVRKLAAICDLDFVEVCEVVERDTDRRARREPIPLPAELAHLKRGPRPRVRLLAIPLVATLGMVPASHGTLDLVVHGAGPAASYRRPLMARGQPCSQAACADAA